MRARSLAIAAWLLSEPYGEARDHTQPMRVGRSHRPGRWNPCAIRPCQWAPRIAFEQADTPQLLEIRERRPVRQGPLRARRASNDFLCLLRDAGCDTPIAQQ